VTPPLDDRPRRGLAEPTSSPADPLPASTSDRSRLALLVVAVLLVAAFFRLYRLDEFPPGLFIDEGQNGMDMLGIARGESFPVYSPGPDPTMGQEPLYHYIGAALFRLFGPSIWTLRLTSAVIGIATVGLFFALAAPRLGAGTAFLGALVLGFNRWHVTLSRIGFRAVLVPFCVVLALLAVEHLRRRRTVTAAALAGAALSVGFYTYQAYWIVPPMVVAMLALAAWRWRASLVAQGIDARRVLLPLVAAFVAGAVLVAAPIAIYAARHPGNFFGRTAVVLDDSPPTPLRIVEGYARALVSIWGRADQEPRHNLPERAFLDPVSGGAVVIGLVAIAKVLARGRQVWALGTVLAFWLLPILPSGATNLSPHTLRLSGALPAICAIAGIGFAALAGFLRRRVNRVAAVAVTAALVATATAVSYHEYFVLWGPDPRVQASHDAQNQKLVEFLADLSHDADIYLTPALYRPPHVRFSIETKADNLAVIRDFEAFQPPPGRDRVVASDSPELNRWIERNVPGVTVLSTYRMQGPSGTFQGKIYRLPVGSTAEAFQPWIVPGRNDTELGDAIDATWRRLRDSPFPW
jgi:4-amino-4-deoxy-L-arabinose transferase-like glycosyltransferase